ncbi:MAG: tetratricopeptide repeat protein [Planctomycetota bacterium]
MIAVPKDLQRLWDELDGWLDLRCPEKVLERIDPLLARDDARAAGLLLRVRTYVFQKRHLEAMADLDELRRTAIGTVQLELPEGSPRRDLHAVKLDDWLDLTEAWCRKRMDDLAGAVRCMLQLIERRPRSAIGHFNLGCYLALAGEPERALDEVTLACGLDAEFRTMLTDEPDLDGLHRDPRFQKLIARPGAAEADADGDDLDDELLAGFEGDSFDFDDDDDDDDDDDPDADDDADDDGPGPFPAPDTPPGWGPLP